MLTFMYGLCCYKQATRIAAFSSRVPTAALSSSTARPARLARQRVVSAAASSEVPPNVAEARAWIAAWRAANEVAPAVEGPAGNGVPSRRRAPKAKAAEAAAAEAPAVEEPAAAAGEAPAAPQNKFGAAQSMADGTLVFTADQLKSVEYNEVLKN